MSLWNKISGLFWKAAPKPAEVTLRGTTYASSPFMFEFEKVGQLTDIKTKIAEIEALDQKDGQVKTLHSKLARIATRGGVRFVCKTENKKMTEIAEEWIRRVGLDKRATRKSHAKRLLKHGNLVIQNVVSGNNRVEQLVTMPTQTMRPEMDDKGQFPNSDNAYSQMDAMSGMTVVTKFARWQIAWVKLDEECNQLYGRPLIDAERKRAMQISMTDDDLVIRRRVRAALRLLHVLEGANEESLQAYKARNRDSLENPLRVDSDLFSNQKGSVTAIQGDANLDQIKDVAYLNQKFYGGAGTHAHHFGILADSLNRDVFEDTLGDLYEMIEEIQESLCDGYNESLRLEFLLNGINADAYDWYLELMGRKVETPNQELDRALKELSANVPEEHVFTETLGLNWDRIIEMRERAREREDPYGTRIEEDLETDENGRPKFTIVEGNKRGKDSATYVGNK